MIATAAESNLSCFLEGPVVDAQTELIPRYLRLVCVKPHFCSRPPEIPPVTVRIL